MIRSLLDTGAFEMHTMFTALRALDGPALAATSRTRLEVTAENGAHLEQQDCSCSITSGDGQPPRTGINIIRLSNGTTVHAMVILDGTGQYEATELEYDLGRPMRCAASPMAALIELREWLEDEIQADARRRDREFRQAVAKAAP